MMIRVFSNELAKVKKDDNWGFIDKNGNVVIPFMYYWAYDFSKEKAKVEFYGETFYINRQNVVLRKYQHPLIEAIFKNS